MSSLHSLNLSVSMLGSLPHGPLLTLPDPVRALCIRYDKSSNSPSDTKEVHQAIIDLLDASPLMRCLSISYTDRVQYMPNRWHILEAGDFVNITNYCSGKNIEINLEKLMHKLSVYDLSSLS